MFEVALADMRDCLADLGTDALNRKPAGPDSNSLAVLATHSLTSTRSWVCIALGRPLPARDRDSEFLAVATDPLAFNDHVHALQADTLSLLRAGAPADWRALRRTHDRPNPDADTQVTGAWALLHAIGHLREHIGQMWLSLQLPSGGLQQD